MLDAMDVLDRDKKTKIHAVQKAGQDKEKADANAPAIEAANEAIIEVIKKYKEIQGEYVALQEEKLYEKWAITAENGRHEKMTTNARAYVTFRSMVGKQKAQQLFEFAEANAKRSEVEHEK
jgi:septum formation topological specificity factor MinE